MSDPRPPVWQWMFRSRRTGRFSAVELPNFLLSIWLACVVLRWTLRPSGVLAAILHATGSAALALWAIDEVIRGVNPFRRALGAAVLALQLGSWWAGR